MKIKNILLIQQFKNSLNYKNINFTHSYICIMDCFLLRVRKHGFMIIKNKNEENLLTNVNTSPLVHYDKKR